MAVACASMRRDGAASPKPASNPAVRTAAIAMVKNRKRMRASNSLIRECWHGRHRYGKQAGVPNPKFAQHLPQPLMRTSDSKGHQPITTYWCGLGSEVRSRISRKVWRTSEPPHQPGFVPEMYGRIM